MAGCVYRESQKEKEMGLFPHYMIEGTVFGEREVMFDRECSATYTALCDCYILKITKKSFMMLMDTCEPFRDEIVKIAREREKIRLTELAKLKDGQEIEENNLMPEKEYEEFSKTVLQIDADNKAAVLRDRKRLLVQVSKQRELYVEWRDL